MAPHLLLFSGLLALLVVVLFTTPLRMLRYMLAGGFGKARAFAGAARAAQRELRARAPAHFPATPHLFSKDMAGQGNSAPMACAVCLVPVLNAEDGRFCLQCGTVAHINCRRFLKPDCKPLSLPLDTPPTHDWRPAGCTLSHVYGTCTAAPPGGGGGLQGEEEQEGEGEELAQCCLYCSEPCEVGLISLEPVWVCSGCHCLAHVQCFVARHPSLFSHAVKAKLQGQLALTWEEGEDNLIHGEAGAAGVGTGTGRAACECGGGATGKADGTAAARGSGNGAGAGEAGSGDGTAGTAGSRNGAAGAAGSGNGAGTPRAGRASTDGSSRSITAAITTATRRVTRRAVAAANGGAAGAGTAGGGAAENGKGGAGRKGGKAVGGLGAEGGGKTDGPAASDGRSGGETGTSKGAAAGAEAGSVGRETGTSAGSSAGAQVNVGRDVKLELCGLGPAARCVLPPTCVRVVAATGPPAAALTAAPTPSRNSSGELLGMVQRAVSGGKRSQLGQGLVAAADKWRRRGRAGGATPGALPSTLSTGSVEAGAITDGGGGGGGESGGAAGPSGWAGGGGGSGSSAADVPQTPSLAGGADKGAARKPWWKRGPGYTRWSGYGLVDEFPAGLRPLLVLINLNSGPQLGRTLHLQLLQLLHPLQVVELPREGPLPALRFFAPLSSHLRILVMGGDGTVGWVLQALDVVAGEQAQGWVQPPVAVLPMGTGNDLARCLGWGGGSSARLRAGLAACLLEVAGSGAHPVPLDRWNITFTPARSAHDSTHRLGGGGGGGLKRLLSKTRHTVAAVGEAVAGGATPAVTKTLNNYLGVGIDAQVALQFHQARSAFPFWFQSQLGNKVIYTGLGAPDLLRRSCVDLHTKVTLECDGVSVDVPEDAQGLVIININCHMGGAYLWEYGLPAPPIHVDSSDPALRRTAAALTTNRRMAVADGLIEVVAVGGITHMGRLAVGLARAQRLAQCSRVVLTTTGALPMQVDGEPWMQEPCTAEVTFKNQALMLRRVGGGPAQRVVAAVNEALDASQERGLITLTQKAALAKEVGRRLEAVLA